MPALHGTAYFVSTLGLEPEPFHTVVDHVADHRPKPVAVDEILDGLI